MKNKKSMEMNPLNIVVGVAVLSLVLVVIVYGIIPIWTGKQVPFIKGQTEYVTEDCDLDGVIGLSDACPCADSVQKSEQLQGKGCSPPSPNSPAIKNCPDLCKKIT